MLKGKGVFAVIAMILVVGLGITSYTSHYINKQKSMDTDTAGGFAAGAAAAETTAAAAPLEAAPQKQEQAAEPKAAQEQAGGGPGAAYAQTAGNAADGQSAPGAAVQPGTEQPEAAGLTAGSVNGQETAEAQMGSRAEEEAQTSQVSVPDQPSYVLISPISGVLEPVYEEDASAETATLMEQREVYLKRLDELSAQIDKMWKADSDATSNSMKQTADYELKMWDNELNKIYQEVRASLNEADAEALKETELQWIKDRDAKALAASKQVGNSSLESLEYTRTLAAITKARTYELVDIYFQENEQQENGQQKNGQQENK